MEVKDTISTNLNERSKKDFLIYANSVIKSRAIPSVEDNLKPIHRKVLYTLYEDKLTPDKQTKKCATEAGRVLAYSPHGDASVYGAMVRMSQWWKLRYPLIYMQGNCGNIFGDTAAASRYTECKLSPVGMLMLEELNKNCVDFKPNYDNTTEEPVTLPSKFPYLLCGNNSGIAVGLSSDLVSHNYNEVADAIQYYLKHTDCSIADLMQFVKGPDFPTGGQIINGEELLGIYTRGQGLIKMRAHYDVVKKGAETVLVFHDLPYGVEIDSGVKAPLKSLVIDDGYDVFKDIEVNKVGPHNFDILITLRKGANVPMCLNTLFTKTRLADTIKVNQTLIVNGEPRLLNFKQLISYWVNYRSNIIKRVSQNDYDKTNHKLTVTIGLQKCMSDIDLLVDLIRNSDSRADAKVKIMKAFELNEEQADAVLDMKLSRLSKLDITELNQDEADLEKTLAQLKKIIEDEQERFSIISKDLDEMRKLIGKDERLTEIIYNRPVEELTNGGENVAVKKEWLVYDDGVIAADEQVSLSNGKTAVQSNLKQVVFAYSRDQIFGYSANGEMFPLLKMGDKLIGAIVNDEKQNKVVTVTKNGNIKLSMASEYKWNKVEKLMKVKDDDELIFAAKCSDQDFLVLYSQKENHILKLAIKDLVAASKLTVGVKSGFEQISTAMVVSNQDLLLCVTSDNKGKFTSVKDFNVDTRGNKGQSIAEGTIFVKPFENTRNNIYLIPKTPAKPIVITKDKLSIKGKMAAGASIGSRSLVDLI